MSWLYSRALVVEFLGESCSDGEPFAQLNVMPMQHKFWRKDKTMEFCDLSQFGLTCRLLTETLGGELLTLFLAGFPVKTSALPEINQESSESEVECGGTWRELLAKYDPDTHSLKTAQTSLIADLIDAYVILPRWGFMLNGALYRLPNVARRTFAKDYGLLPTPTCTDHKGSTPYQVQRRQKKNNGMTLREWLAKFSKAEETVYPNPGLLEKVMGMPDGWTELAPLEMHKFQEWLHEHSIFCQNNKGEN